MYFIIFFIWRNFNIIFIIIKSRIIASDSRVTEVPYLKIKP